jgi:hypothetical protein
MGKTKTGKTKAGKTKAGKTKTSALPALAFILLCGVVQVQAAPILYDINFTSFFNPDPPISGSFDYNAAAAVGSQFTNFDVIWEGTTFDLTAAANNPVGRNADTSTCIPSVDSAGFFAGLLNPENCLSLGTVWTAELGFPGNIAAFGIETDAPGDANSLQADVSQFTSYGGPEVSDQGRWTISTVPEPGLLSLVLIGTLALIGINRCRVLRRAPQQSES